MKILGIETSCDDTALALIEATPNHTTVLAEKISTWDGGMYGGVVPELSSRQHENQLPILLEHVQNTVSFPLSDIDAIGVTTHPGLWGSLLVGKTFAQALAFQWNIPWYQVNHLEAHGLVVRMTETVEFPFLLLLVSGGHSQFRWVESLQHTRILGSTRDDALGECFDKVARALNLPQGAALEPLAAQGDPRAFSLPCPLYKEKGCDFSFSGLKTAALRCIETHNIAKDLAKIAHFSASFHFTIDRILQDRFYNILTEHPYIQRCVIAGGVAANAIIFQGLRNIAAQHNVSVHKPPLSHCTDNGVMVAWHTWEHIHHAQCLNQPPLE